MRATPMMLEMRMPKRMAQRTYSILGKVMWWGFGVGVEEVLDEFAGVADDRQERDAGQQAEQGGFFFGDAARGVGWILGAEVGQIG